MSEQVNPSGDDFEWVNAWAANPKPVAKISPVPPAPPVRPAADADMWFAAHAVLSPQPTAHEFVRTGGPVAPPPSDITLENSRVVHAAHAMPVESGERVAVASPATLVPGPGLLEHDIAEIERACEVLAEPAPFVIDARKLRRSRLAALRNSDSVPILVGSVVGATLLLVFGAAASLISLR